MKTNNVHHFSIIIIFLWDGFFPFVQMDCLLFIIIPCILIIDVFWNTKISWKEQYQSFNHSHVVIHFDSIYTSCFPRNTCRQWYHLSFLFHTEWLSFCLFSIFDPFSEANIPFGSTKNIFKPSQKITWIYKLCTTTIPFSIYNFIFVYTYRFFFFENWKSLIVFK